MNLKEIEDEFKRMCEMQGPAIRARVPRSHIRSLISRVKELEKASDGLLFYLEDNVMPPIACTRDLRAALGEK